MTNFAVPEPLPALPHQSTVSSSSVAPLSDLAFILCTEQSVLQNLNLNVTRKMRAKGREQPFQASPKEYNSLYSILFIPSGHVPKTRCALVSLSCSTDLVLGREICHFYRCQFCYDINSENCSFSYFFGVIKSPSSCHRCCTDNHVILVDRIIVHI